MDALLSYVVGRSNLIEAKNIELDNISDEMETSSDGSKCKISNSLDSTLSSCNDEIMKGTL